MDAAAALAILRDLAVRLGAGRAEFGIRDGAAYLKIEPETPGRWAVVWTPGDRWFALDVDGGFSRSHFEEDLPDEKVRARLDELARVAVRYLDGEGRMVHSRLLRIPSVVLDDTELTLSVVGTIRVLLRGSWLRRAERG